MLGQEADRTPIIARATTSTDLAVVVVVVAVVDAVVEAEASIEVAPPVLTSPSVRHSRRLTMEMAWVRHPQVEILPMQYTRKDLATTEGVVSLMVIDRGAAEDAASCREVLAVVAVTACGVEVAVVVVAAVLGEAAARTIRHSIGSKLALTTMKKKWSSLRLLKSSYESTTRNSIL